MPRSSERETFYADVLRRAFDDLDAWAVSDDVRWYEGPDNYWRLSPQRQGGYNFTGTLVLPDGTRHKLTPAHIGKAFSMIHANEVKDLLVGKKEWFEYVWKNLDSGALGVEDLNILLKIAISES